MNSKILLIKSKLKKYLDDKEILDIIVFGSFIKGKVAPNDIDIAIITNQELKINLNGFHVSIMKPKDFFVNTPSLINTLLREGYSLKNNKPLSEVYKFSSKVMYTYELTNLSLSEKVKIVNILRGKNGNKGMVLENKGEWLAKQVFLIPIETDNLIEKFFLNFKIKFHKWHILMH